MSSRELWKKICDQEGVRYVKKSSTEYDRVKKRFKKNMIHHATKERDISCSIERMEQQVQAYLDK